jgi:hypothetical protein
MPRLVSKGGLAAAKTLRWAAVPAHSVKACIRWDNQGFYELKGEELALVGNRNAVTVATSHQ